MKKEAPILQREAVEVEQRVFNKKEENREG